MPDTAAIVIHMDTTTRSGYANIPPMISYKTIPIISLQLLCFSILFRVIFVGDLFRLLVDPLLRFLERLQDFFWKRIFGRLSRFCGCLFQLQLLFYELIFCFDRLLDLLYCPLNFYLHVWKVELLGNELPVPALQHHDVFGSTVCLGLHDTGDFFLLAGGGARGGARDLAGWVHETCGVDFVEFGGRVGGREVVFEEEFEVLGTGEGFPVRVGAVDEVEEGQVRNAAIGSIQNTWSCGSG